MSNTDSSKNVTLTIKSLGSQGEGVGFLHGYKLFVDGALPGEVVRGRINDKTDRFGRVDLLEVIEESPARTIPPCPLFDRCGGCQIMHVSYNFQLEMKRKRLIEAFKTHRGIENVRIDPCVPSPKPMSYRNKIQVPVISGPDGIEMGLYAKNSHQLVDIDHCLVHCELGERVYGVCRELIRNSTVIPYDPPTGTGELRYLVIKTAVNSGEVLVMFVTASEASPSLRQIAKEVIVRCPEVKGVVQNINTSAGNTVLGDQFQPLEGADHIAEILCGLRFKVSPASFFQVNTEQAEQLYRQVDLFAELDGTQTVLDAYCGVGTMALVLAKRAKQVIGVECVREAISDAQENAVRNGIENVSFVCAAAEDYIANLAHIDVAVLNPPRKGCDPVVLAELGRLKPAKVIYVSCDPVTLARDLAILVSDGYTVEQVRPFDMFPHTSHVETVVKLRLRAS